MLFFFNFFFIFGGVGGIVFVFCLSFWVFGGVLGGVFFLFFVFLVLLGVLLFFIRRSSTLHSNEIYEEIYEHLPKRTIKNDK